jgi:hypothetical protein
MNYLILFNHGTNGTVHLIKNKFKENVNMCHNVVKKIETCALLLLNIKFFKLLNT